MLQFCIDEFARESMIVPIPIHFNEVEIGAIPTALHEKKIKVGMENGTIPNEIRIANFLGPRSLYRFAFDFRRFNFVGYSTAFGKSGKDFSPSP